MSHCIKITLSTNLKLYFFFFEVLPLGIEGLGLNDEPSHKAKTTSGYTDEEKKVYTECC